jgi:dUTP pyrophosphatase
MNGKNWWTTPTGTKFKLKSDQDPLTVKFKKLYSDAVTPSYAKDGDAGLDLTATHMMWDDTYIEYGTGIAVEIPNGYVGLVFPRSSVSKKENFYLKNSVGVIDSGYRGEIKLRFNKSDTYYEVGEKVGQLIIMPYPTIQLEEVTELSNTDRGNGGFGSTGK